MANYTGNTTATTNFILGGGTAATFVLAGPNTFQGPLSIGTGVNVR